MTLLQQRLSVLERIAPSEFSIFHYNVLADQYASNLQPWYLHGAGVSDEERRALRKKFYEKDEEGAYINVGWPSWAKGILSPKRRSAAESFNRQMFTWEGRRERLWERVGGADSDVVTLAECDHYDDFWRETFLNAGYNSIWRKRPRASSADGCAIAWHRSVFDLVASDGVDFADSYKQSEKGQLDRTFLMALLRFRRNPGQMLVVVTTHLARNPEKSSQQLPRGYQVRQANSYSSSVVWRALCSVNCEPSDHCLALQYGKLFRELLDFAKDHNAVNVPVIVTGDLNAQCVDELSAIAKAVAVATGGIDKVCSFTALKIFRAAAPATTGASGAQCFAGRADACDDEDRGARDAHRLLAVPDIKAQIVGRRPRTLH